MIRPAIRNGAIMREMMRNRRARSRCFLLGVHAASHSSSIDSTSTERPFAIASAKVSDAPTDVRHRRTCTASTRSPRVPGETATLMRRVCASRSNRSSTHRSATSGIKSPESRVRDWPSASSAESGSSNSSSVEIRPSPRIADASERSERRRFAALSAAFADRCCSRRRNELIAADARLASDSAMAISSSADS